MKELDKQELLKCIDAGRRHLRSLESLELVRVLSLEQSHLAFVLCVVGKGEERLAGLDVTVPVYKASVIGVKNVGILYAQLWRLCLQASTFYRVPLLSRIQIRSF